jgi:hypothetical protein
MFSKGKITNKIIRSLPFSGEVRLRPGTGEALKIKTGNDQLLDLPRLVEH